MSLVRNSLLPNEEIYYSTHPHWVILLSPIVLFTLAFLASQQKNSLALLTYLFGLMGTLLGITNLNDLIFSAYVVTNKRLLIKRGWFNRQLITIGKEKVESIEVQQSILGQLFNFGQITLHGIGGSQDYLYNVPNPLAFRELILRQGIAK